MKHLSPFVQSHEEKQEIWGLLLQKMEASFGEMQRQQRQQTTTTTTTSTTTTRNASVPPTTGNNVSITSKANKTHDPFFNDDGDDADMYAEVHAAHDDHANQAQDQNDIFAICNAELSLYKNTVGMRMEPGNDPLQWWLERKDQFPILFRMAE
jgi:hypothetical protein